MNSLFTYLFVGIVLLGLAVGKRSERCGEFIEPTPSEAVMAIVMWPAAIAAALFDYEVTLPPCGSE